MRSGRDRVQHVAAEAARVAQRRALVVDAAVDAAAEVLDEAAEDARVHGADPPVQVDARSGPWRSSPAMRIGSDFAGQEADARVSTNRRLAREAEHRAERRDAAPRLTIVVQAAHADGELDLHRQLVTRIPDRRLWPTSSVSSADPHARRRCSAVRSAPPPAAPRRARPSAKATITYWNGLTGADGKVMDELIDQFTSETGIKIEQQRILWADLYAKLQVVGAGRRGPGPGADPHRRGSALRQRRHPGARWTTATLGGEGLQGEDYLPSPWQGGIYQGKRYSLPLDVPQHLLYMNMKVMKDAGLVGAGRQAQGAGEPGRARGHGEADHEGRHLRLRASARVNPGKLHVGLPQPALAERRERLRARPQALGARRAGGDRGGRVLGRALRAAQDRAAGERELRATRSSRASSACGSRAPGTSPACARPRSTSWRRRCRASSSSRSSGRCRTSTPSPSRRPSTAAKRDAAWAHIRWMTDHVAEWTLKAGQVSASRKAHADPRITGDPVLPHAARPGGQLAGRASRRRSGSRRRTSRGR